MSFRGKYKLSKENGLYNEIDTIEGANGPEIKINGKSYINLSSNNYLGLATNEDLKSAAKAAIDTWCRCRRCSYNQWYIRFTRRIRRNTSKI